MSNVLVDETCLQAIANSIRAKNGSTDSYKPGDMAAAIDAIEGGGLPKDLEWVNHSYAVSFYGDNIIDEVVTLSFPSTVKSFTNFWNLSSANHTTKHVILNLEGQITTALKLFFTAGQVNANIGMYALEHFTINADTSKCTNFGSFIRSCGIKVIDGTPLDFSSATTIGSFCNRCFLLSYIRIVPNTIKVDADFSGSYSWDDESLDSIVYGLAKVEETKTLMLHTNVTLRLTTDHWAYIESNNWRVG